MNVDVDGQRILFTGFRDSNLNEQVQNDGGIVMPSWNKNVTLLVVADRNSNSTKVRKARTAGIPIMTVGDFADNTGYDLEERNNKKGLQFSY